MIVLCVGLQGWMGEDCSKPCVHGKVDGASCVCDPCYTGAGCELECSGNGRCVNDTCDCFSTVIGTNCHQKKLSCQFTTRFCLFWNYFRIVKTFLQVGNIGQFSFTVIFLILLWYSGFSVL